MDILFIAPQPFYQERGTPIAIRFALATLCKAGHRVDLLTYHEGEDVKMQGLRILRIPKPPLVSNVPIGPSWKKLVCDLYLSARIPACLAAKRYDVIHAVEEAIFPALLANLVARKRLVYDMDSSMADQLMERWPQMRLFRPVLDGFERLAVRRSSLVLPVCQALADKAAQHAPGKPVHILHDIAFEPEPEAAHRAEDLRRSLGLRGLMALYVGNLERYQGMGPMLEGFAMLGPDERIDLVVIGGNGAEIESHRALAHRLGVADRAHFIGPRPLALLPHYLTQADILLSPRLKGQNTPMKIYAYLLAGRAILASNIGSHTQVLDDSCALLAEPKPPALAEGLKRLARDPDLRARLGRAAAALARERYSHAEFERRLMAAYAVLGTGAPPGAP